MQLIQQKNQEEQFRNWSLEGEQGTEKAVDFSAITTQLQYFMHERIYKLHLTFTPTH